MIFWRLLHICRGVLPGVLAALLAIAAPSVAQAPLDLDGDGMADAVDNCLVIVNADQADADADGTGDACDRMPLDADDNGSLVIVPQSLNLNSKGRVVTAFIELPVPFHPAALDLTSLRLEGLLPWLAPPNPKTGDGDGDGIPALMVKFSRTDLIGVLCATGRDQGTVELRVTGGVAGSPLEIRGLARVHGTCP